MILNWEAIGAVGQMAGAIALVATLLYLAIQIRQNAQSIRSTTAFWVNQALAEINRRVSNDPEFADLLLRGMKDYRELSEVERVRFASFVYDMINLAVYIHVISNASRGGEPLQNVHINYVNYLSGLVRENPGFRQFLDWLEKRWPGPEDLFRQLRKEAMDDASDPYI